MVREKDFYSEIRVALRDLTLKRSGLQEVCQDVNEKYGFPLGMVSDVVTQRTDMEDAPKELLFAIAKTLEMKVTSFFTESEVKKYSKYKYVVQNIKFPFTFESHMIEIVPDKQYIGKTTARELMKLRDAQLIDYNEKTQRSLVLKQGNNFGYYRIDLNRKAIVKMSELFINGDFVPNTLTLNLPPDTDFTYHNEQLIINEMTKFDLLDGYHRYITLSNCFNNDINFDYPMEIRIMFKDEEDARQFIYQEDQRTPLSKIDVSAMNKNDIGVKICRFIKDELKDNIIGTNGIINEPLFIRLIDLLYVNNHVTYNRPKIVAIAKEILGIIRGVEDEVESLLGEKWSTNFTIQFLGLAQRKGLRGLKLYNEAKEKSSKMGKEERFELLTTRHLNSLL